MTRAEVIQWLAADIDPDRPGVDVTSTVRQVLSRTLSLPEEDIDHVLTVVATAALLTMKTPEQSAAVAFVWGARIGRHVAEAEHLEERLR